MKAEKKGGADATGTIATDIGTAAKAVAEITGGGEIGTTNMFPHHATTAEGTGIGAEVAMHIITGDTNATISRAAGVLAGITDGGADPETGMGTSTAADLPTRGRVWIPAVDEANNEDPLTFERRGRLL